MAKRTQTDKTVHVSFSQEDYEAVKTKAESVGMNVTAYIRQQALTGQVKGYNMNPLIRHTLALDKMITMVRIILDTPLTNRWQYEADIERIEKLLDECVMYEKKTHEMLIRRVVRKK